MLYHVLVTIAMVFHHKLTQASWCSAVSENVEVMPMSGNKVHPNPADPGCFWTAPLSFCQRDSSFTPCLPKANCFILFVLVRKYSLSLEFYCSLADLGLYQTTIKTTTQGPWPLICAAEPPH